MKHLIWLALPFSLQAAVTIEFYGPCSSRPVISERVMTGVNSNVGTLTINLLNKKGVPYQGTEQGLNQVYQSPIGQRALEIISDQEMRSYGWCYSVDGRNPEVYPDQFKIGPQHRRIQWYFGHAHYKNGQWVSQCEVTFKLQPRFLCR